MKNSIQTLTIAVATFALGLGLNSFTIGDMPANYKVAIVDINTVVAKSAQVQALKKEQLKKTEELQKWLNSARADIAKQSTEANKQKLTQKYETTFAKKQEEIQKNYANKLAAIDKSISATIEKYKIVNAESDVLCPLHYLQFLNIYYLSNSIFPHQLHKIIFYTFSCNFIKI